jgi:hypothetical protein
MPKQGNFRITFLLSSLEEGIKCFDYFFKRKEETYNSIIYFDGMVDL